MSNQSLSEPNVPLDHFDQNDNTEESLPNISTANDDDSNDDDSLEPPKKRIKGIGYCGVPQCSSYRHPDVPLFKIPQRIRDNPKELKKWSSILRMGKKFPSQFRICCKHFDPKSILIAASKHVKVNPILIKGAFPCRNLPILPTIRKTREYGRSERLAKRTQVIECSSSKFIEMDNEGQDSALEVSEGPPVKEIVSIGVQCDQEKSNKGTQANGKMYISIVSLWDTDKKINTMTGIPSMAILNVLVDIFKDVRPVEKCLISVKDRICLTMHKLKSNCSFAQLAIWFQVSDRTAKLYFADTIQLLAKVTKGLIHWQTREENERSLPKCFERFPNVRTILDCTEIKTATFNCLACRVCTYSHYKGTHTLKFLIGVSPSGSINYVSRVATGRSSDKAIFNCTDLIGKLQRGDAVMVDKGFLIGDELASAGIEMIRPGFLFEKFSKRDVENNTRIASARVHVERRISRLKQFRILSDKISVSVIPYIDDIVGVLCGISNISPPILSDARF